ncbi:MAG: ATP-binding protein [Planctomycetes bacterium]|nr:ATP-binding protein [Planctomycetota bacterium]
MQATHEAAPIRPRARDAILHTLAAGVVPSRGHQHIPVGRHPEVQALLEDIERVADGGSAIRFVIGSYGSGKTFFLQLVGSIARERRLVTVGADLTPDRRLYSTSGHGRALYAELMRNMATRGKPDGGALPSVVEKFVGSALAAAREEGVEPAAVLQRRLEALSEMVGGYDFARVIECYWRGHESGDEELKTNAVRWLRAEFATRTDARKALGVRTIIDDGTVYDSLKLMGRFLRLAGFGGLLVELDELVNLYKMTNGRARNTNFEQILRILNDCLQGGAEGLGFVLGGTPEFLTDTRRGLFSYEALQSRLSENRFAGDGLVDYSGPVLRLDNLSLEDFFVLLRNLRHVQAGGEEQRYLLPDEGLKAFMDHCHQRIGEAYFRTPRNTIKSFVQLLAVLDQNPGTSWQELVGDLRVDDDRNPDFEPLPEDAEDGAGEGDDDLASFQL